MKIVNREFVSGGKKYNILEKVCKEDVRNGVLIIPNNVEIINENACKDTIKPFGVKILVIPSSVKVIGDGAFCFLPIERVVFEGESNLTLIGDYAFARTKIKSFKFPKSVKYAGKGAFAMSLMEELKLNEGLEELGQNCFEGCKSLKYVRFPSSLKVIPEYCFSDCGITYVDLREGTIEIKEGAFSNCQEIRNIALPSSLKKVRENAFKDSYCQNLSMFDSTKFHKNAINFDKIPYITKRIACKNREHEQE